MSWDNDLAADVRDELFWDPKVDNAEIAVSADEGKVTLRGTVGRLREKREAKKAAQRVFGVISVDNQLQVKLMTERRRDDSELRGDVLQALMLDSLVPKTVDAKVDDGFVTLTGTAEWQYQRDEAEFVAANIAGALDVFDEIEIEHPTPKDGDVQESIKKAFKRNASLDATDLSISSDNGTVTISGAVSSWAEHVRARLHDGRVLMQQRAVRAAATCRLSRPVGAHAASTVRRAAAARSEPAAPRAPRPGGRGFPRRPRAVRSAPASRSR
jgi:osmotically-inducible protein OsmY